MKNKIILAFALLFSLLATPAYAQRCDWCVTGAVNAANAAINANLLRVIGAIQGNTQTLATETARTGEMVAQANQRTEATMEQTRQDDRYRLSDGCAVLASSRGTQDAGRSGVSLGGGVGRGGGGGGAGGGGVTANMTRALRISNGAEAAPSPEAQAALASSGACSSFVNSSANGVRATACTNAGFNPASSNGHPDADIRAETLFDGPQRGATAAQYRRKLTIDPEGAEKVALEAYLRNLNTPIDLRALKRGELQTDAGRQYMTYRDAFEARMSLAEKPARSMAANRIANRELLPVVQQLLASPVSGQFVRTYLDRNYPNWSRNGISLDELTNLEAERRYLNRDWHLQMANMPPEAHTKEQTTIMAFNALLMARMLEKMDMQAVVAGQGAATQVRQEMLPQLIQLHSAASK